MRTEQVQVESGSVVVATFLAKQADSMADVVAGWTEAEIVRMVNAQHRADRANKRRAIFNSPGKTEKQAIKLLKAGKVAEAGELMKLVSAEQAAELAKVEAEDAD